MTGFILAGAFILAINGALLIGFALSQILVTIGELFEEMLKE